MDGATFSRRQVLLGGAVAGAGIVLGGTTEAPAESPPRIRRYAPLGKTGIEISDVSFGSSRLGEEEDLVRYAFDLGINYFDTAETYNGGISEQTLGRALRGKRDRVFLTSKTIASASASRSEMMQALEGSLRRLATDHVDVYFNHAVNDVERMKNPEWPEFVSRAKQQGKIRASGMSGHAGRLSSCLEHVIDHDLVDVILVAYNFGQDPAFYQRFLGGFDMVALQPELPRLLERAKRKGIGVVAMKTLMGARLNDMRPYEKGGATFAQAAFRWVLSNPHVDALIVSMTSRERIAEYVAASGGSVRAGDVPLLGRYVFRNGDSSCRFGCDRCESACPNGVAIGEVLRTRMYARDYGDVPFARREYAMLGAGASACTGCEHRSCSGACPHGLPIPDLTADTHRRLGNGVGGLFPDLART
ncbi:MAG: uncharacterized protein QOD06_1773 [Candidatus Binatota bacterium]|nr:uncharacterized protein [Candidatus Binatota bacterium]